MFIDFILLLSCDSACSQKWVCIVRETGCYDDDDDGGDSDYGDSCDRGVRANSKTTTTTTAGRYRPPGDEIK